jgi:dihydroorotate dehydrogenase
MGWPWMLGRRAFFALDPERSHRVALSLLGMPAPWERIGGAVPDLGSAAEVAGVVLANRVGLAAGFDKACERLTPLGRLGFGYVVGGTLTHEPRAGNARPRIARTVSDRALVNAMGLPNPGAAAAGRALARAPRTTSRWVSLADEPTADAVAALRLVAPHADAIELNASSPNAGWSHRADHVREVGAAFTDETDRPLFVKLPPFRSDDERAGVLAMATAAAEAGASGITCANTVPVADVRLSTGRGGLSGGPLTLATPGMVASLREATGLPVHACGGIFDAADARACLDAGAATVQIYTGFIYGGPRVVGDIVRGLRGEGAGDGPRD